MKPAHPEHRSNPAMGVPAPPPAPQDEERLLVERAKGGDTAAFRELVERHQDRAYGLALRMLRSTGEAEEVAQDAFMRAWRALPRFRGEASFGTWLHAIVARRAIDRAEVMRRRQARETSLEQAGDLAEPEAGAEAGRGEIGARLEPLLERLSGLQRAAVTLYYYEDRSVEEVATMLGIPENTVKTHLSRARAALRRGWLAGEVA